MPISFENSTVFEWEGLPVNEDTNGEDFFNDMVVNELKDKIMEKNCSSYKNELIEKIGNAWKLLSSAENI